MEKKNQETQLVIPQEVIDTLKRQDNVNNSTDELSKHALLKEISEDHKSAWFTQYRNYDEVLQMCDIETHKRLLPVVFGQRKNKGDRIEFDQARTNKAVDKIQNIFLEHTMDYKRNMSAYKDTQLKALVYALKNDSGVSEPSKEIKRLFGAR